MTNNNTYKSLQAFRDYVVQKAKYNLAAKKVEDNEFFISKANRPVNQQQTKPISRKSTNRPQSQMVKAENTIEP